MKAQMVVLGNLVERRGRSLVGILLQEGRPAMKLGRPQWIRPLVHKAKPYIPVAMIADLVPRDVIEFELQPDASLEGPDGFIEIDFYSLHILGQMPLEDLIACCSSPHDGAIVELAAQDMLGHAVCMVLACSCVVVVNSLSGRAEDVELRFGFCGFDFQFPVSDPHFLASVSVSPDVLDVNESRQLVLLPKNGKGPEAKGFRVAAIL